MPKYSVIIPVYNCENYLTPCVRSVLDQICSDFELLLVDDGSTDGSGMLCDQLAEQDSRIRVFHKENGGAASARNYGLDHAVGHGVLRRVEVLETVVADQDVGLAPFVQDVVEEDGLRLAEFAFEALVAIQDAGSVREENLPAGSQGNPSAAALEELAAGKLLQLGDVLADRRLRDAERLGGSGEAAQFGDTLEYA